MLATSGSPIMRHATEKSKLVRLDSLPINSRCQLQADPDSGRPARPLRLLSLGVGSATVQFEGVSLDADDDNPKKSGRMRTSIALGTMVEALDE